MNLGNKWGVLVFLMWGWFLFVCLFVSLVTLGSDSRTSCRGGKHSTSPECRDQVFNAWIWGHRQTLALSKRWLHRPPCTSLAAFLPLFYFLSSPVKLKWEKNRAFPVQLRKMLLMLRWLCQHAPPKASTGMASPPNRYWLPCFLKELCIIFLSEVLQWSVVLCKTRYPGADEVSF